MLRHNSRNIFFFLIYKLKQYFWKFWLKKAKKHAFFVLPFLGKDFHKYCLNQNLKKEKEKKGKKKKKKKKTLEKCLNTISKQF